MAAVQGVSIYWTSTDQFPFLKKAFKCFALVFAASIGSISFLSLISTEDYIDIGIDEKLKEQTCSRFYVAVTRARYSVGIVLPDKEANQLNDIYQVWENTFE